MNHEDINKIEDIRTKIFRESHYPDSDLVELIDGLDSHEFLANPSGHISYVYLTRLITSIAAEVFDKPLGEIQMLDWGCGKGHVSYLLKKYGANIKSCDIQSGLGDASFSQETPIIDRYKIDVIPLTHEYRLPFQDNSFDVVVGFGVLEHVKNDCMSLEELNRILCRGGLFFCFFLPYVYSWTQRLSHIKGDYYHDRLYSKSQVIRMLNDANFTLLDCWHRALFPKNSVRYRHFNAFEKIDHFLCRWTPFKYLATNLEFISVKT